MSEQIDFEIAELKQMKQYPENLFYIGNLDLLKKRKVSIVGTRHPNNYAKKLTYQIAQELIKKDIVIVSGGAIGVDAIAHQSAGSENTIAVVANGLDIRYPKINEKLIKSIEKNGLMLSSYKDKEEARNYTFVQRNEIVVSLGEILIVTQADEKSGTLTSIKHALRMGKKVYTIPHHIGDSLGTQKLLDKGLIEPIYDLNSFIKIFGNKKRKESTVESYLKTQPLYENALKKLGEKLYELELDGAFSVKNGYIIPSN